VLPGLGSKMVYGYLDAPAAKDQPSIKEVAAKLPWLI
jgi:3-dehydroquinate dehydratase